MFAWTACDAGHRNLEDLPDNPANRLIFSNDRAGVGISLMGHPKLGGQMMLVRR
jgi:hypothetical protein